MFDFVLCVVFVSVSIIVSVLDELVLAPSKMVADS